MNETVEQFRARARAWLSDNMPRLDAAGRRESMDTEHYQRARDLQRLLWDGGFAGICWPEEYGGLGLGYDYQRAFTEESLPYEMPLLLNVPTFGILAATLIDYGTHDQKARHLPAILRGEELWVQFLSEPTGGSDLAGCLTRADRDGDVYLLNGSKIWSSAAYTADYGMCLARTNWDVPKHRGLSMFIVKIHQPAIKVERIRQVNGYREFCQEFFDDVQLGATDLIGEPEQGWSVASRLLLHERTAVGGGSPYTSGRSVSADSGDVDRSLIELAVTAGRDDDSRVRQLVADCHVEDVVYRQLVDRIGQGMRTGVLPASSGSILKLFHAMIGVKRAAASVEIAADSLSTWQSTSSDGIGSRLGEITLNRQALCLGGGSNEIQKNIISERVLAMPREWAADRDIPYRDVRRSSTPGGVRSTGADSASDQRLSGDT